MLRAPTYKGYYKGTIRVLKNIGATIRVTIRLLRFFFTGSLGCLKVCLTCFEHKLVLGLILLEVQICATSRWLGHGCSVGTDGLCVDVWDMDALWEHGCWMQTLEKTQENVKILR